MNLFAVNLIGIHKYTFANAINVTNIFGQVLAG